MVYILHIFYRIVIEITDSSTPERKRSRRERRKIKREHDSSAERKRYKKKKRRHDSPVKKKKKKEKTDKRRTRKHKDTSVEHPIEDNKYVIPVSKLSHTLIRCICGSTSWDSVMLTCVYCGVLNHGSCYSILNIIDNACHVCGYCSVVNNVMCTEDSVKAIYSIRDLSQADWAHVEGELVYTLEVGTNSIPLYGKLTHMLQGQSNSQNSGFNCQLLLSMNEHAVA